MAFTASKRFQKTVRQIGVYGGLAFFLFIMLFPFYWMFITSIKPNAEIYNLAQFPLIVKQPTLEHYGYLLQNTPFLVWLKNSLLVAIVATAVSLTVGTMAAYALARLRFRGAQAIGVTIFVSYLIPRALLFLPLAYVVRNLGLFDKPHCTDAHLSKLS